MIRSVIQLSAKLALLAAGAVVEIVFAALGDDVEPRVVVESGLFVTTSEFRQLS